MLMVFKQAAGSVTDREYLCYLTNSGFLVEELRGKCGAVLLASSSFVCVSPHISSFSISDVSMISICKEKSVKSCLAEVSGGFAFHQNEASVSSGMCNKRGRYLSQINSISRSSDFYHDPFDNWCFYERLWMTTEISHLREESHLSVILLQFDLVAGKSLKT